jgi:hypothetical protein
MFGSIRLRHAERAAWKSIHRNLTAYIWGGDVDYALALYLFCA